MPSKMSSVPRPLNERITGSIITTPVILINFREIYPASATRSGWHRYEGRINRLRDPNDNGSPCYIRIADNSGLNRTDTVFSEVLFGIEVADDINAAGRRPISRGAIFGIRISGGWTHIWSYGL